MEETTNQMPEMNQTNMNSVPTSNKDQKDTMKLVIALVLVIILAFILNMTNNKKSANLDSEIMQKQASIKATDPSVKILETQGTGDSITDIEKDLNSTNVDVLTQ